MSSVAHTLDEKIRTKDVLIEEQLNFSALLLSEPVLSGLQINGFNVPSPIQLKAIPIGKCGFDLIIKSKSGTGKTAVFSIIALEHINTKKNSVQALILTPTREIAVQIQDVLRNIGSQFKDLKVEFFIGGLPVEDDVKKLSMCHIAVGAPGRIKHLLRLGSLKASGIKLFVLDEADKLVSSDMQADIDFISKKLPVTKQTIASSATYSDDVIVYLNKLMSKPTLVDPHTDTPILLGLKQFVSIVKSNLNVVHQLNIKNDELMRLLSQITFTQCLVFTNYQTRAESISNTLNRHGWKTMYMSGAQNQPDRLKVINLLKEGKYRILLTTDISARGIDIADIDLVINYDVPLEASTYLHRMGRAGRFGTQGICITIASKGQELDEYRKILGAIGGVNVRQLPNEGNLPDNLWNIDSSTFGLIQGIVDNSSKSLKDISTSITALKVQRNRSKKEDSDEGNVSSELHAEQGEHCDDIVVSQEGTLINTEGNVPNVIETILNSNKEKEEYSQSKLASIDTIAFLKDLASGTNVPAPPTLEQKSIPVDQIYLNDNLIDTSQIKKRKRQNENSYFEFGNSAEIKQDDQASTSNSDVIQKNLALFNATKLLSDAYETNDISDNLVSTLDVYLDDLKKEKVNKVEEMPSKQEILHEICDEGDKNISEKSHIETTKNQKVTYENSSSGNIEDIFKLSFDYAINEQQTHWIDGFDEDLEEKMSLCDIREDKFEAGSPILFQIAPKRRKYKSSRKKKTFKDFTQKSKKYKRDIVEDQSMAFYGDQQLDPTTYQVDSNYSYQAGLYSDYEYASNQHFTTCFDSYSNELTEKLQTFEDMQQFEMWFAEWQWQVQGVRDYVQQNVYLQEMNKYAYGKY